MRKEELRLYWEASKIILRHGIPQKINALKYDLSVGRKEQKEAIQSAQVFLGEFFDFMRQDTTNLLAPLKPDKTHMDIISSAFGHIQNGTGHEDSAYRYRDDNGDAIFHLSYTGIDEGQLDMLGDPKLSGLNYTFILNSWNVSQNFPESIHISGERWGFNGRDVTVEYPVLDFLPFPNLIQDESDLPYFMKRDLGNEKTWTDICQEGKRLVTQSEWVSDGQLHNTTEQHHFLGAFDGLDSGRTYFIYGNNENNNTNRKSPQAVENVVYSQATQFS